VKQNIWAKWVICASAVLFGLLQAGCTGDKGLDFSYSPVPATVAPALGAPESVTVYEFTDNREQQTYVGQALADPYSPLQRTIYYQVSRPVGQIVTDAVVSNLESQGFRVIRASGWNLDPGTLYSVASELAVGGTVKAFWTEATPYYSSESAVVNIHVVIVDAPGKRVLWEGDIVGTETFRTDTIANALFSSRPDPTQLLQKAFSGAIDELSTDPGIQRALKSAILQRLGLLFRF